MYRIIGVDGKEYGPIAADVLKQWIAEGRANAETRTMAEGAAEWRLLGSFPEFAPWLKLPSAAHPAPALLSGLTPVRQNNAFAIAGLTLGILAFVGCCCCYGLPFNLAGLLCSFIGLVQIRGEPDRYQGESIAIAGLVLSFISVVLSVVLFLLAILGGSPHWLRQVHRL